MPAPPPQHDTSTHRQVAAPTPPGGAGPSRQAGFWRRQTQLHVHLWLAVAAGVAAGAAAQAWGVLGQGLRPALLGWSVGALVYVLCVWRLARRATPADMRHRARLQDETKPVMLLLVLASIASALVAVVRVLGQAKGLPEAQALLATGLAGATVLLSWLLLHAVFALHYAHLFYGDDDDPATTERGGLAFPHTAQPDYGDFLYLALVVGTSAQTADVSYTSRAMRRVGALHAVLAFFFNTAVLALLVNVLGGLV